jgi:hypothetical protein
MTADRSFHLFSGSESTSLWSADTCVRLSGRHPRASNLDPQRIAPPAETQSNAKAQRSLIPLSGSERIAPVFPPPLDPPSAANLHRSTLRPAIMPHNCRMTRMHKVGSCGKSALHRIRSSMRRHVRVTTDLKEFNCSFLHWVRTPTWSVVQA